MKLYITFIFKTYALSKAKTSAGNVKLRKKPVLLDMVEINLSNAPIHQFRPPNPLIHS